MGNDVPDVTCTALRCVLRLGMARPRPMPMAIAMTIHTGRNRSRSESRLMTGTERSPSDNSETTSLTSVRDYGSPQSQQHGAASDVARDSLAQHVSSVAHNKESFASASTV